MIEQLLQADRALSVGMIDQAERLYRLVAEQDPKNAIAVVGLARVTLERGDEGAAYEHVRRALELDPQNQPALRMEARLSEILTARGQRVRRPAFVEAAMDARSSSVRLGRPGPRRADVSATPSGVAGSPPRPEGTGDTASDDEPAGDGEPQRRRKGFLGRLLRG